MQTDELSIKYLFDDHEIADLAREQSRALSQKASTEDEMKAVNTDYKSRVAAKDAEISSLSIRINTGFEMRYIKHIVMDHRLAGYRLMVRTDTGHVTKRRKLNPEETQLTITTEPPPPYIANAALKIDDDAWSEDGCLVPIFEDEFEILRSLPDVVIHPVIPKGNRIGDGAE